MYLFPLRRPSLCGLFVGFLLIGFFGQRVTARKAFQDFWHPVDMQAPATDLPRLQQLNLIASPAQQSAELRLDDGTVESGGLQDGLILVNRITPPSYPATLQRLRILFPTFTNQPSPVGKSITLLVATETSGSGSIPAFSQFTKITATVPGTSTTDFFDLNIPNGPTLTSGDFYIGFQAATPHQGVGFGLDTNNSNAQAQNRTYISFDSGSSFTVLPAPTGGTSAIAMMRAVVLLPNATSAPTIDVLPAQLDFGQAAVNTSLDRSLTVRNTGSAQLTINNVTSNNARFTVLTSGFPLTVAAGSQQSIGIRFTPTASQNESGTITIASNDPTRASLTVPVSGSGIQPGSSVIALSSGTAQTGQVGGGSGGCGLAVTQYSIVVPAGAASLQIALNGTQDVDLYARFNTAVGLQSGQIVADFRATSLSNSETITITPTTTPALQAGTYFIAISNCSSSSANFTLTATVSTNTGGQITEELSADDNTPESGLSGNGVLFVNRLTPSRYPSRLQRVRIYFAQFTGQSDPSNQQIRLLVFNNPTNSSLPPSPALYVDRQVTIPVITTPRFVEYEITENATITEGDWVVGFQSPNPSNGVACVVDVSSTFQNRSFARASSGTVWQSLGANALIRAVTVSGSQPQCTYAISPTSQNVTAAGGNGTVNVTAPSGCAWTATSNAAWLTVNSGASGTGNGAVTFTVAANQTTAQRTGTITVAGQTFTVTQAGLPCTYSIAPTSQSFSAAGGNGSTEVTALAGCAWTAVGNANFITINSGASGNGSGTVSFTVAANPTTAQRTGTITVAGQTFTVTQEGIVCSYTVTPTSLTIPANGSTNSTVNVTAQAGCAWTAASNAAFITVNSGASGNGNGTVTFTVAANSVTTARTGTLTVAGQTITISQAALPCTYSIAPTAQNFPANGGNGSTAVTAPAGCGWTATSNAQWISISTGASGNGNGNVSFTVVANPNGTTRQGTLTIAEQTFTVTQDAAACTYSLTPTNQNFTASGGNGTVTVTAPNGCAWTATSQSSPFITITSGASGNGNGTVAFSVAVNPNGSTRTGTISIAGQTFTVNQAAAACTYSISPTAQSFEASGGVGTINITSPNDCEWTATSNAAWLTVTSGQSGSRSGAVAFSVAANTSITSRTGTLTVAGQTFTVTQAGQPCAFSISPSTFTATNAGGSSTINVTSQSGCVWSAASNAGWLSVTSGGSGNGNGVVTFSVAVNTTNAQRVGTLTVAGQTFTVTQAGANLVTSVSAASYQGAALATDSIVAAFGTGMATRSEIANTLPLPTTLAGTTVRIRDSVGTERLAQLFIAFPQQVNYLMPVGLADGPATVLITSGDGTVSAGTVNITSLAPGLFSANADGQGPAVGLALRVRADGSQVYESLVTFNATTGRFTAVPVDVSNANEQVFLVLFGTGFRGTARLSDVTAQVGGVSAEALYAGKQGDLVGVDQLNLRLDRSLSGRGEVDVKLNIFGRDANVVRVAIR